MIKRIAAALAVGAYLGAAGALSTAAPAAAATVRTAATAESPAPTATSDRVDRVAAALAKDHLFVDPDLGFVMDTTQRAKVDAALQTTERRITVPIYVVTIPNPGAGDRHRDPGFFLFALHDRMKRDGVYVLVDDGGVITDLPFQVPRDIQSAGFGSDESIAEPADVHQPFLSVPDRLVRLMSSLAATPSASPTDPFRDTSPPLPPSRPGKPNLISHFLLGLLLLGPVSGLFIYGLARLAERLFGRRQSAPIKPVARNLRPIAVKEIARLREALDKPENEDNQGRSFALTAFDAAETLFTELTERTDLDDRVLDLVGVIVLARMGGDALAARTPRPDPPCRLNPLHGPGIKRKNVRLPLYYDWMEQCRLCASCAARPAVDRILQVRTAEGTSPYITADSFWGSAFGSSVSDLPTRVLEHLGVND